MDVKGFLKCLKDLNQQIRAKEVIVNLVRLKRATGKAKKGVNE